MSAFDEIADCLFAALATSNVGSLRDLDKSLRKYKDKYAVSWTGVLQTPATKKLLDAIHDAIAINAIGNGDDNET